MAEKTFNELFDDFFNDEENKKLVNKIVDLTNLINKLSSSGKMDEEDIKQLDETLGLPDKIEYIEENGVYLEKRIWNTDLGELIEIIVTDKPNLPEPPEYSINVKSLEEQLNEAVSEENYELAADLRDKIKKK